MDKIIVLNEFLKCPQKRNIGSIRFLLLLTNIISNFSDSEKKSLIRHNGLLVRSNALSTFYGLNKSAVRALMNSDTSWLSDLSWLEKDGSCKYCFKSVTYISYKGYYIEFEENFINLLLSNSTESISFDPKLFAKIDSLYGQIIFLMLLIAKNNLLVISDLEIRKLFDIESCYINSNSLYKKCIKNPCEKLSRIYKNNFVSEKVVVDNDIEWVVKKV